MRFASVRIGRNETFGLVMDDGFVDARPVFAGRFTTLSDAIGAGALREVGQALSARSPEIHLGDVDWLPVIPRPGKMVCAGVNYGAHAKETGRTVATRPSMFARFSDTLLGHGEPLLRPRASIQLDFEGELAVVIGKPGRAIPADRALEHVAGYTCFNDGSIRDYQKYSVTSGKNFPATGPLGPWMVTADEIADPQALTLMTRLNGVEVQRTGTASMIYPVRELIAFVSAFTALAPGDVIATGTPEGVGSRRDPQLWMKPGDTIEVEISRIGVLCNPIADEAGGHHG